MKVFKRNILIMTSTIQLYMKFYLELEMRSKENGEKKKEFHLISMEKIKCLGRFW